MTDGSVRTSATKAATGMGHHNGFPHPVADLVDRYLRVFLGAQVRLVVWEVDGVATMAALGQHVDHPAPRGRSLGGAVQHHEVHTGHNGPPEIVRDSVFALGWFR